MEFLLKILILSFVLILAQSLGVMYLNPGCFKYDEEGFCIQCSSRYYKDSEGICQPVNPYCNGYNRSTGQCVSCYSGFAIVQGSCLPQFLVSATFDPFCNQLQGKKCIKCSKGYYFDENGKCIKADPFCKKIDKNKCLECYQGYRLEQNKCLVQKRYYNFQDPYCNEYDNGICVKCSHGYHFSNQNICKKIPDECKEFSLQNLKCLQCYSGYKLNNQGKCVENQLEIKSDNCNFYKNGKCYRCSYGYYFNDKNICIKTPDQCQDFAVQQRKCYKCYSGYQLDENYQCKVKIQQVSDPKCNKFKNGKCVKCSFGFYFNKQNKCKEIPSSCEKFNKQLQICEVCYDGYELVKQQCILTQKSVTKVYCKVFQNGICKECIDSSVLMPDNTCKLVDPLCKTYNKITGNCESCFGGYYLNNGQCTYQKQLTIDPYCRTFQNNICVQCSYRYFKNIQGICQFVDPLCDKYNMKNGNCQSCFVGFKLQNNRCQKMIQKLQDPNCANWIDGFCSECSLGSYFDEQGKCKLVDDKCKTYDKRDGGCLSCYNAFKLIDKKCVQDYGYVSKDPNCKQWVQGHCMNCSEGYYFGDQGICIKVNDLCNTYNPKNGYCLSCFRGYKLQQYGGKCFEDKEFRIDPNCAQFSDNICIKCSMGFYFDENKKCQLSDPLCKEYDYNVGNCILCYIGFDLKNGKCQIKQDNQYSDPYCAQWIDEMCIKCSNRTFFNNLGKCQLVDQKCKTFNMLDGSCQSCYTGFRLDNRECIRNQQKSSCIEKDINGICVKCAYRFYLDNSNNCIQVDQYCIDFDEQSNKCRGCYTGYSLKDNRCQISKVKEGKQINNCFAYNPQGDCFECFERFYLSEYNICSEVDVFCKTYNRQNGKCLSCYQGLGFQLIEGECKKQ